jgi:peptidoglycan hydrolase FlgJ
MLKANNADVYTDLNGLAQLKTAARQQSPEAVKAAAKQFEAIFVGNVLKSMRDAKLADGISDNDQSRFYKEMYDQQLAVHLSGKPGVGLADLIVKQLTHDDKKDDNQKMGLEDYLNRSSSASKTVSRGHHADGKPSSSRDNSDWVRQNKEIFRSYLQNKQPAKEFAEIKLKNGESRPIHSAEDFVQKLYPYAEQAAKELGVEPKVLLAQAALETGWGRSVIKNSDGSSSFNLFNIKAGRSWQGDQATVSTLEYDNGVARKERAGFRSYDSYKESFHDYVQFIKNNPRYRNALEHAGNSERYLQELQRAGYATDPGYARKIMGIYHGDALAQAAAQPLADNGGASLAPRTPRA